MFPTNSEHLIGISDAFSAFVYGYPSSCPRAHCTPNKSVPTLRYTRRHGPVYTGHASRQLPSAVPWISEDRLFKDGKIWTNWSCLQSFALPSISHFILFCRWLFLIENLLPMDPFEAAVLITCWHWPFKSLILFVLIVDFYCYIKCDV